MMLYDFSRMAQRLMAIEEGRRIQEEALELRLELQHRRANLRYQVAGLKWAVFKAQ
jgi:hypothetical protein